MSQILNAIRDAIKAGPKSRYQLSKETKIDAAALSRLMHTNRGMGVENAEKLAAALGIKITVSKGKAP